MVESMTGFGRSEARSDGTFAEVEVRSVNNRFCDVSVRLPRHLGEFEYEVQQIVKKVVGRGKVNVHIRIEQRSDGSTDLQVDEQLVSSYKGLLDQLRSAAKIDEEVRLEHVLTFSDVFIRTDGEGEAQRSWNIALEALNSALKSFKEMRLAEGAVLADDMNAWLEEMSEKLTEIERRAPERVAESAQKLLTR